MTGVSALGARAIGDAGLRDLASEWSGPRPAGAGTRSGGNGVAQPERHIIRPVR